MESKLFKICTDNILPPNMNVVIPEPYVPYIPNEWNEILVLAEAQNLSKSSSDQYVRKLKSMSTEERIFRLFPDGRFRCAAQVVTSNIGVHPWDDGSLKLAIESACGTKAENTAVSNAVPWSQVDENENNITPSWELISRSIKFWEKLLPLIVPKHIISCGKKAQRVIDDLSNGLWTGKHSRLRLPSRAAMSRVSSMFSEKDLLSRYEEVKKVVERHPEWAEKPYRQNKIFFACHAVSRLKGNWE